MEDVTPRGCLFGHECCLACCKEMIRESFEQGLAECHTVGLFVGFHEKVVIPPELKTAEWKKGTRIVYLDYGLDMPIPIDDMKIAEDGVSATLSFNRSPFLTTVPWEAVVTIGLGGKRPAAKPKLRLLP